MKRVRRPMREVTNRFARDERLAAAIVVWLILFGVLAALGRETRTLGWLLVAIGLLVAWLHEAAGRSRE